MLLTVKTLQNQTFKVEVDSSATVSNACQKLFDFFLSNPMMLNVVHE